MTKYPDIEVELTGTGGNAFAIMSKVSTGLRRAGVDKDEIAAFRDECMAGDYYALRRTCMAWVCVT